MANPENIESKKIRSTSEAREKGRNGGIASGKSRRKKKLLSQIYGELLIDEYEVTISGEKKKITGDKLIKNVARDVLMRRDSSSVSMMREIREATEGNSVVVSGLLETSSLSPEERRKRIEELEKKRRDK